MTWQLLVVACCALAVVCYLTAACLWIARRRYTNTAAMPGEDDVLSAWPLSGGDDGAAVPYLRGGSHAAGLSGRR